MTLIATYHSDDQGFLAFSDVLVSTSDNREGDQNTLPIQFGLGNGFGTHAVRCASKAVLFGNYIVLWAGKVEAARCLIRKFMELTNPSIEDFRRTIDENPSLSREVKLIYGCNDGETVWHSDWGCKSVHKDGLELIAGGTGDDDFLTGTSIQMTSESGDEAASGATISKHFSSKLGELINLELTSFTHKWSAYGGAYEMFVARQDGGGFMRVNYSLVEISNRLHIEQKWSDLMEIPARLIQIIGKSDRSICILRLFSPENVDQTVVFDICDIMQDQSRGDVRIDADDIIPTWSFAYVIGSGFSWSFEPDTHYANFKLEEAAGKISVVVNEDACKRLVRRYYDHGFKIYPGSSGFDPWNEREP